MEKSILIILTLLACTFGAHGQNNDMSEVYALKKQAKTQNENGSFVESVKTINKALKLCEKTTGKDDTAYVELLCTKSELYFLNGEPDKALRFNTEAKRIQAKVEGKRFQRYAEILENEAACHLQMGNLGSASRTMKEALQTASKCMDTSGYEYATILSNASYLARELGSFEESVSLAMKSIAIMESCQATDSSEYSTALENCAQSLYLSGSYDKAYDFALRAVNSYKVHAANADFNYLYAKLTLAQTMNAIGKYDEAASQAKEVQRVFVSTYGKGNPFYCIIQGVIVDIYSVMGEYNQCIKELTDAISVSESIYGVDAMENINLIGRLGNIYNMTGNGTKALQYANRCVEICRINKATKTMDYAQSLECMASAYKNMGVYDSAYTNQSSALKMYKKKLGSGNEHYIQCLGTLAEICRLNHDFDKALQLQSRAVEITDSIFGEKSQPGAYSRLALADVYNDLDYYSKASGIAEESLKILKAIYNDPYHKDCRNVMERLIIYYNNGCKYEMAINMSLDLVQYAQKHLDENNNDHSHYLYLLSICYGNAGQFPKAVQAGEESCRLIAKIFDHESQQYVDALKNLAIQYNNLGNNNEAIRCREEELSLRKKIFGNDVNKYSECIISLSQLYAGLGMEKEMSRTMAPLYIQYLRQTNQLMKLTGYKDTIAIPTEKVLLKNPDVYYNRMSKFYEEFVTAIERDSKLNKIFQGNEYFYNQFFSNYSVVTTLNGNPDKALQYLFKLLPLREKQLGKNNSGYAQMLGSIARCYAQLEEYDSAMFYIKDAIRIESQLVDSTSPGITRALGDLIVYARYGGALDSAEIWTSQLTRLFTKQVKQKFIELSSSERAMFWQGYRGWFEMVLPSRVNETPSPMMVETALNGTLFSKGLLLSTDMELRRIIQENGNNNLTELYDTLRYTRLWLEKLYTLPVEQRKVSTDSLEHVATSLERRLSSQSTAFGDITAAFNVDWHDVQNKLKPHEAAVEFVNYSDKDSTYYSAFIFRKGDSNPTYVTMTPLPSSYKLNKKVVYDNGELSRWLWGTISKAMNDVKTVYFAPSGELYNIGIEYLPDFQDTTQRIDKRWNLYRLSSTRELALHKKQTLSDSVVIYGGIKYDTDTTFLKLDSKRYPRTRTLSLYNISDSIGVRGGYATPLPGTKIEAQNVYSSLRQQKYQCILYTDSLASESSFKALSGGKRSLIHIATHGFYWTPDSAALLYSDIQSLRFEGKDEIHFSEDKSLNRSGLLFSGANNALGGGVVPDGTDDGILTAKEIAEMDLRGLDMVVLSACQTALGDISGEGVFGLQRGFKKAGAQTLLMSLWKVDDRATQLLMSRFYSNFAKGMSKRSALQDAQSYLRGYKETRTIEIKQHTDDCSLHLDSDDCPMVKYEKGEQPFVRPVYWAAFILLDAFE